MVYNDNDDKRIVLMEHELLIEGITLRETKEMTTEVGDKVTMVHTRMIGDRAFQFKEEKQSGKTVNTTVHTAMDKDELEEFEAEWKQMWDPVISDEEVAKEIVPALQAKWKGLFR